MSQELVAPDDSRAAIVANSPIAIDNFELAAGGRSKMLERLSAHPALTRADQQALDLIADPRNDTKQLSKICGKGGITLGRLLQLYKDAGIARAQLAAMDRIIERAAPVADTILDYAFRQKVACEICEGTGSIVVATKDKEGNEVREPKPCRGCDGLGWEILRPTTNDRKLAAEVIGLVKGSGGVEVNVLAQANSSAAGAVVAEDSWFAQFQEATDRVLYGDPRALRGAHVVEGEVDDAGRIQDRDAGTGAGDVEPAEPA